MSNYFIHIDSSTKNKENPKVSYGNSATGWTIKCNGSVIRAGLIYSHVNGPNKMIYEGVLAALSTLEPEHFYPGGTDRVFVFIDSQVVVNQLNDTNTATQMKNHLSLVKKICARHPNVKFSFSYKNEKSPEFKEVDILSKLGRAWIPKIVNSLKK